MGDGETGRSGYFWFSILPVSLFPPLPVSLTVRRHSSLIIFTLWLCLVVKLFSGAGAAVALPENNCARCHRLERGRLAQVVAIYETSAHHKAQVSCADCHGGDAGQSEKTKAHAGNFISRPDASGTLAMCGSCHAQPLALFKSSRHFPEYRNVPRLDCAECHGVHGIGALAASSEWTTFCAGCHGLEYLPPLPQQFQEMLALSDELREAFRAMEEKRVKPSNDLMQRRREIRQRISEIVHPTDLNGGLERIPSILASGAALKKQLGAGQ